MWHEQANFCPKCESCWLHLQCKITPFGNFMRNKNSNNKPNHFTVTSQKRDIRICSTLGLLSLGVTIPFGPHRYWAQLVFSLLEAKCFSEFEPPVEDQGAIKYYCTKVAVELKSSHNKTPEKQECSPSGTILNLFPRVVATQEHKLKTIVCNGISSTVTENKAQ